MKRKFDNFDRFSKKYHQIHNQNIKISGATSNYFNEYKVKEIKNSEKNKKINKILDLGCGDGSSIKYFLKYFKKSKLYGIDISKKSIKIAKTKKFPRSHFFVYNGFSLPFKNKIFDIVFLACVFHHINKKYHPKIINEIKRVLKNNGRIYIFEHNPYNPLTKKIVRNCIFDKKVKLIVANYFVKLFKKAGFKKINVKYTLFLPRYSFLKKIIFIEKYLYKIPFGGQYFIIGEK